MLSPRPPQGVSATTGVGAGLDRLRLPEAPAAGHVDVEEMHLPVNGDHGPGGVEQDGAVADLVAPRARSGKPPRSSQVPVAARQLLHRAAGSGRRGVVGAPAPRHQAGSLGDRQAVVAVVAQIGEVLGQADQQRPGAWRPDGPAPAHARGWPPRPRSRSSEPRRRPAPTCHPNGKATPPPPGHTTRNRDQTTPSAAARTTKHPKKPKILAFSPSAAVLRTADHHVIKRGLERLRCLRNRVGRVPALFIARHIFVSKHSCERTSKTCGRSLSPTFATLASI